LRKIKLYIAISLNGKIAKADGSVDWLESIPNPDKSDYGYYDFYKSIDTTIQGYNTYKQIVDWDIDFPYADKKNYVLTRKQDLANNKDVDFINENPISFIKNLKRESGKDIWLIGGGQINTMLLNEWLIDEIHLHVMPIIITDGISLFEHIPKETKLDLIASKNYPSGVVELKYSL
jgi:dihydrofolate reductase